jgi:hypothetical protein
MFHVCLALFGCKISPSTSTSSAMLGPFTIQTQTQSGKRWDINYGRVSYSSSSYSVYYKDQPIPFGRRLETNTGLPGVWRIFLLKDAPEPALIAGSQSLYMVTIDHDQPVVRTLFEQGYDFASIQWLDSEDGQPGPYREIYSSDDQDTEVELSGGRFLAVSHAVVLDTKTLTLFPFNTNNDPVDGYDVGQHRAIAFSPDSTQVVYLGSRQDEQDYTVSHLALTCYAFKTGKKYAVPFDKIKLRAYDEFNLYAEWLQDYFEWVKNEQGELQLQLKKFEHPPYPKGYVLFDRFPGYHYRLYPVKETLMNSLYTYMRDQLSLDTSQVQKIHEPYNNKITIPYQGRQFILEYGKYGDDLVLYEDGNPTSYEVNKQIIQQIGKGFNALLSHGEFQDQFTEGSINK